MKKFLFFLILFSSLYFKGEAFAQQTRSVTVSPASVNIVLSPGEQKSGVAKVKNNSRETLNFEVGVFDFIVNDTKGTPELITSKEQLSSKYSLASWLDINQKSFSLGPSEIKEISYTIKIPQNGRPGGHYAAIVYKPQSISDSQNDTQVFTQIGIPFYVHLRGEITENAQIIQLAVKQLSTGQLLVTSEIQNLGDLHIRPVGKIVLIDIFGHELETQDITQNNIFPEKSYIYENVFQKKLGLGHYTIKLSATYGENNNRPLTSQITITIFPWEKVLLITLVAIISILFLSIFLKRKSSKTYQDTEQENKN